MLDPQLRCRYMVTQTRRNIVIAGEERVAARGKRFRTGGHCLTNGAFINDKQFHLNCPQSALNPKHDGIWEIVEGYLGATGEMLHRTRAPAARASSREVSRS